MREIETKLEWTKEFDTETTDYYKAREKAMEILANNLMIRRFEMGKKKATKHWHITFYYWSQTFIDKEINIDN